MKFDKTSGKWVDDLKGPKQFTNLKFRQRQEGAANECRKRWEALESRRVEVGLSASELDEYALLASLAFDYLDTALRPTRIREDREGAGLENKNADRRDKAEDRRDEIRQVYKPGMSAGDVERALNQHSFGPYKRSTIEKDLKKIRGSAR